LYELAPDASCTTLFADVLTFNLEGVSGTATLVDVDDGNGSFLAEADCVGEPIFNGAALFARMGHS
jgi:hypothetical protein